MEFRPKSELHFSFKKSQEKRTKLNPSSPSIPFLHFLLKEEESEKEKENGFLHASIPSSSPFKNEMKKKTLESLETDSRENKRRGARLESRAMYVKKTEKGDIE